MSDQPITVQRVSDDAFVVSIRGEHDMSTAPMLSESFDELFASGSLVIADLSETTFLDSQIIRVFKAAAERSAVDGRERFALVVDIEQSHARRLFEVSRPIIGDIPTFPTRNAALDALRARHP